MVCYIMVLYGEILSALPRLLQELKIEEPSRLKESGIGVKY